MTSSPSGHGAPAPPPRVAPGTAAQIGRVNAVIAWAIGRFGGTGRPPNVFTTLARNRSLFRRWLIFVSGLMPRGSLPRADTELVILRVAWNCGSEYEWGHHERLARAAGLSEREIAGIRQGPGEALFSERQALLLRAADELHQERVISDASWEPLSVIFPAPQLIEICMLVGHYEMLAMTLSSLRVAPDA